MTLSIRLFRWVAALLFLYSGIAQAQVTVSNVAPSTVCAGGNVSFTYTNQTGFFSQTNIFLVGPSTNPTSQTLRTIAAGPTSGFVSVTIPSSTIGGNYTIRVVDQVTNSSATTAQSFTVVARPAPPTTSGVTYCQNAVAQPLTASGQNLRWYTAASGGTPFTSITPSTATPGTTTYYVSQINSNGCESDRAPLTVTVNALPNAPTTTNVSYCQGATAAPLTASGQNLRWYTAASGGTPFTSITPSTSTTGTTTYYVTQTDNNGCESNRTPLTVTINAIPPAPSVANTSVVYCQNTTAQPLQATATSGNTLNWYNSQGTALGSTAPTPQTTNPGTTFYQVSQRNASGCEGPRVQITVTINTAPAAPATSPVNVCQGGATVSLVNSVTATGTLKWYTSPTSASLAAAPQVATSTTGSQVFYVSQTNANGCESSRAAITYTVNALPNPPSVVSPVTYCQNAVAQPLQATPSPGGTLNFYTVSSGGTSTTSLTPQTQSSNNYYVSQTVNGCESSSRATITVTINAQPPRPAVTTPVIYCQFATASPLSATATTNNTLVWYALNGQQLGSAPTPPTTTTGVTSYSVSQRDPLGCISQPAIISVTINAKPAAPLTTPLSACLNTPAPALPTSVTATGTLRWYTASAGGVGATVAPTLSTSATGSTPYYVSQTSADGCESDRAVIVYTVNPLPSPPIPTPRTVFYCQGATATPLTASGQNLKWYLTRTTSVSATSITPSTAIANSVNYYVSQTNANGCESARDSVTVITGSRPVAPTVVSPVTYCQNAVATSLSATAIPTNTLKWYGTDPANTTFTTQATIPATTTPGTFTYYVSQTDGNSCESDKASIVVRVNPLPTTPVTSSITVCQNASTVSLPSAVVATGTLKWYTAPTGGVGSTTAPVLSTSAATTYTYYVSQTDANGCESNRATLTATVNPLPAAPTVVRNVVPICQSSPPVQLTAIASANGTLRWYEENSISYTSVAPSPPTDIVKPYVYRVTQFVDGCESASPTSVTAVIIAKPTAPTVVVPAPYCQFATPTSLSATGLNLRWYADPTTAQTIPTPTPSTSTSGVTTYYVTQTDLNGCQSDRASIAVQVKAKPAPPVTAPIAFCANAVSSLTAIAGAGGTLNWYGMNQSGGTASATAPVPSTSVVGAPINYYVSQTVNGCESDRASLAVTIKALPVAPTVSAAPVVYCQGVAAQPLTATPAATGTLNWYLTQTGGTSSPTAFTPSTASSVPPTSYYYVSQTVDGCEGPRATIAVTINPRPIAPTVTPAITYCQNAVATPLTATASGTLRWYTDPSGSPAIPIPTPQTVTPGITNYYVTQTDGNGCESDRSTIVVTINALPIAPVVSQTAVVVCQNSLPVTLMATAVIGGTLNWYTTVNGPPSSAAPAPPTNTAGTQTYYVSQSVNGCEGPKTTISVTTIALPAAPTVSTPVNYCQNVVAQPLTATANAGGTLNWYDPAGNLLASGAPTPNTTVPGTLVYSVSQSVNGCEGPKASITVNIRQAPAVPTTTPTLAYCQNTVAPALTATSAIGGTLNWYTVPTGGSASSVAPIPSTTAPGTQIYYVSQTVNSCESDRAVSTVTIKATPAAPALISPTVSLCQGSTATPLTAIPATGGTLNWYTTIGGPASPVAPTPTTNAAGQQTYYVSQTVDGCEGPTASIVVTVNALPAAPVVATPSVRFCQNSTSTALTALASPGGTLYWHTGAGGTGSTTAPVPPTNTIGTQTYLVSQRINGCEGPQTAITVTIDPLPAAPATSPVPVTYCQGVTALPLAATPGTGGTLNWYTTAGGAPSQTPPAPPTTTPGLFTYYVSQSVNGCEGPQAAIVVLINATPVAPTAGAVPIYCQNGTSTALAAIPSSGGTLNWYTTPTGGSSSPAPPTPPVGSAGTVTYYVSQSIGGCEGPRIQLTATIKPSPAAPTVTPTLAYCQNSVAPALTATPTAGTLNWYTVPTGGAGSVTPPVPPTNTVGTQSYYVSQSTADGCEGPRAAIAVTIRALPAAPATTPLSVCQNATPPSLALSVAAFGQVNWYTSQTGGTPSTAPPVPATANPGPITYFVSQTDANGCESQRSLLLVTVTPTPAAPVVSTIAPVCQNTTPIVLTAAGQGLRWYADATSTGSLGSSIVQQTGVAGTFAYYVSQTVSNCESPRALAQVVVNATPTAPVVQATQSGCQDALAQPLTASGTALQWYDANDSQIGTPTPDTRVETTQTYSYKVTQTVNGCVSPKAVVLYTVTVLPVPTVTTPVIYCQNQPGAPLQASGSGLRWIDPSGAVTNVAPTPLTSAITAGASYSVSQTNAQGCESRRAEIRVTINAQAVAVLSGTTTVSLGGTAPLTLTLSGVGPYSYTLSNGTSGIAESATSATITRTISVTPTATMTYTLLGVSNGCGAGLASGSATVTVNTPSILTGALSASSVCAGGIIDVPYAVSGTFTPGNTFVVEIAAVGELATRQFTAISTGAVQGSSISTRIPTTFSQGLYLVRVRATNSNYPIVSDPSATTLNVRALPTGRISTVNTAVLRGNRVQLDFTFSGDAPWSATYRDRTGTKSISTSSTPYSVTFTADSSTTYRLLSVTNECGPGRIDGVDSVRVRVDVLTADESPFATSVSVYPVPTDGDLTIEIDDPMLKNEAEIQLIRPNGQTARTVKTRKRQTVIKLVDEPAGTYLLQIKLGDRSTVRRVLKQ